MAHILQVTLVEVFSLLCHKEVDQLVVTLEILSTDKKQLLSLLTLLSEL